MTNIFLKIDNLTDKPNNMEPNTRLKPKLVPLKMTKSDTTGPQTAHIMEDTILEIPEEGEIEEKNKRTYSLNNRPQRNLEATSKRKLSRQKTVSGDSQDKVYMKLHRTYTVTSNASSSLPADEWRRLFDRYDEYNGNIDGQIPIKDFEKVRRFLS